MMIRCTARGGDRTLDTVIKSHVLFRLSYTSLMPVIEACLFAMTGLFKLARLLRDIRPKMDMRGFHHRLKADRSDEEVLRLFRYYARESGVFAQSLWIQFPFYVIHKQIEAVLCGVLVV